jgi:hypothetical protein
MFGFIHNLIWMWFATRIWRGGRSLEISGIHRLLSQISTLSDTAIIQAMGYVLSGIPFGFMELDRAQQRGYESLSKSLKVLLLEPKHCKARSTSRVTPPP